MCVPNVGKCVSLDISFQAVLVASVVLSRYGNDGLRLFFGSGGDFFGVGATIGLAMFTPMLLVSYVAGGSILALVSAETRTGFTCFAAVYLFDFIYIFQVQCMVCYGIVGTILVTCLKFLCFEPFFVFWVILKLFGNICLGKTKWRSEKRVAFTFDRQIGALVLLPFQSAILLDRFSCWAVHSLVNNNY